MEKLRGRHIIDLFKDGIETDRFLVLDKNDNIILMLDDECQIQEYCVVGKPGEFFIVSTHGWGAKTVTYAQFYRIDGNTFYNAEQVVDNGWNISGVDVLDIVATRITPEVV